MKHLALLLLLSILASGSKILTYNIYDRNDRVDVMLTFDTPYEGVLRQNQEGNQITIKLEQATLDAPIIKNVTSAYLNKISVTPNAEELIITANVADHVSLQASKTSDSYGLRLRFSAPSSLSSSPLLSSENSNVRQTSGLPTKQSNEFEQSYYVVIALLLIGIGVLFWLKQSITKKANALRNEPKTPWLFNNTTVPNTGIPPVSPISNTIESGGVHVRFQKVLDTNHTVAMLDYGTMSYLVLLGNNTLLLDKFQDNIPITQNDFENMLQSKHRELDGFFQIPSPADDTFDAYKEKASGIY